VVLPAIVIPVLPAAPPEAHCSVLIPRHGSHQRIARHKAMLFLAFLIGYEEFIGKRFSDW
jgi:hypothetical protein